MLTADICLVAVVRSKLLCPPSGRDDLHGRRATGLRRAAQTDVEAAAPCPRTSGCRRQRQPQGTAELPPGEGDESEDGALRQAGAAPGEARAADSGPGEKVHRLLQRHGLER